MAEVLIVLSKIKGRGGGSQLSRVCCAKKTGLVFQNDSTALSQTMYVTSHKCSRVHFQKMGINNKFYSLLLYLMFKSFYVLFEYFSKFEPKTQQLIIDFSAVENVPKRNSDVND